MAAVSQRNPVKAGVRIGQNRRAQLAPGLAVVVRPRLDDLSLAASHQRLEPSSLVKKDGRLNHAELLAVIDGAGAPPSLAEVGCVLEVDEPAVVLRAGRSGQCAVVGVAGLFVY